MKSFVSTLLPATQHPSPGSFSEFCDNLGRGHDTAFVHFMMTCVYCQQYLPWAALSEGVGYVYRHNAEFGDGKPGLKSVYFEYSPRLYMPSILPSLESSDQAR